MDDHSSNQKLKKEPFENLFFPRSYPDNFLQIDQQKKINQKVLVEMKFGEKLIDSVDWRLEGPTNIGGRINTIEVNPLSPEIIFVGNSTGGVFKTNNGGDSWFPIGDEFSNLSIGSIKIAPSNNQVIYVGTGDPNISGIPHVGNGVYKSIDGGLTWEHKGLELPKIISRIIVDPTNENIVYAATMGLPFERSDDRGLYKTINGGDTWEQILFVSDEAGITDLVINPNDPLILFASSWTRIRNNTESLVTGTDAHIYKSLDGGVSWEVMTNGLPDGEQGRIGLSISVSNPNVLYSVWMNTDSQIGGIFKTSDNGGTWVEIVLPEELGNAVGGFGWYFGQIRVSPYDENEISVLGVDLYTSFDGGANWEMSTPAWYTYEVHADKHDLFYVNQNTILLATDGGLYRSTDHFSSWDDIENIPNTQFYHVAYNPHHPGVYTGGAQDNGTTSGDFQNPQEWVRDYGGDGFQALFDPFDENIKYAQTQNGNFVKFDGFSWNSFNDGIDSDDRVNWDAPFVLSPHDNGKLYTGTYRVYVNINDFWQPISEDLTDGDIFGARYHTISVVNESPLVEGVLYVGTTDGNVHRTLDGGATWEGVFDDLPDRYVTDVKASPVDNNTVFVTHSGYKDNDNTAHIHRSDDNGSTWSDITGDLIEQPVNQIEILNDSVYFIATDFGVYMTDNSGVNWSRVGTNMPVIPVFDLVIDPLENRLVAGTFARSIQSIDLEELLSSTPNVFVEELTDLSIKVFPNPTADYININGVFGNWLAIITTVEGKEVLREMGGGSQGRVDVSRINPGNYVVTIFIGDLSKSIMVQVLRD